MDSFLWLTYCGVLQSIRWPSGIERLLLDRLTRGSIPSRVKPMTLTLVFTASLLDVQHLRDSVGKPASLLVVPLGKALSGIPTSTCGRQMAGNSSASSYSASSLSRDKRINACIIMRDTTAYQ